ncbi:MAG: ATP-binding cassette domain-containing protein [Elusimicrobiota bacterium]|nr:ATP-binding cassette domain-containing protein [Elusimicrobiota bacterium]
MKPAVRAVGLGKLFRRTSPRHDTIIGRLRHPVGPADSTWALREVSFEVGRGECFGVCGPAGSGKTTLLRLVAGILEPTEGLLEVDGRTNALLSLRAALHPELSVLENVEICGVLMGLRLTQIRRRAEAILDFAELTGRAGLRMSELPAGQAARVSFATAVHADLDILLIDEALAVGDAAFTAKCESALTRLRREGTTILAASHDPSLLARVASRHLRLDGGRGVATGAAPARAELRVLFIGNSLTAGAAPGTDTPALLEALGAAGAPRVEARAMTESGETLQGHWEKGRALAAIRAGRWDFVVLQEEGSLAARGAPESADHARRFDAAIRAAGARTALLMTWARRERPESQAALSAFYRGLAAALDARLAPVGEAWAAAREEKPELELHAADGAHAGPLGAFLSACVLYRTLTGEAPRAPAGGDAVTSAARAYLASRA